MVFLTYFFQSFARSHQPCAVNIAGGLECEQSLFFFRFMEENARARASSETLETTAAAREDKRESLFFFRFRGEGGGGMHARELRARR